MDFAFNEEQQMLREQARSFSARSHPGGACGRARRVGDTSTRHCGRRWRVSGGPGLSVPEEQGGSGMGFLDEAILFEELGYGLYPGPYFSTVGVALPVLASNRRCA